MEIHRSIKILIILSLICTSLLAQSQGHKTIVIQFTGLGRPYIRPSVISSKKINQRLFFKKLYVTGLTKEHKKSILKGSFFYLNKSDFTSIHEVIQNFPFDEHVPDIEYYFDVYIYEKKKLKEMYHIPNKIAAKELFLLMEEAIFKKKDIKHISSIIAFLDWMIINLQ